MWPVAAYPKFGEPLAMLTPNGPSEGVAAPPTATVAGAKNVCGYACSTQPGDCGAPVVSLSLSYEKNALLGIHIADKIFAKFNFEWLGKNFPN